jgi:glycosyltransferase involved in cell wall biosynthesis
MIYRRADWIIAIDKLCLEQARKNGAAHKVSLMMNAVDPSIFRPDTSIRGEGRSRYGCGKDEFVLLFAGRLEEVKKVDKIIDSLACSNNSSKMKLFIAGDGSLKKALQKRVRELNLTDRIFFLGYVAHDELPSLYNMADAFILPSIMEGAPMVVLEALACGTPVIATGVGGIPDLVENGKNGFLLDNPTPKDIFRAILRVTENPLNRSDIAGSVSRRHAGNVAKELNALFSNLVRGNGSLASRSEELASSDLWPKPKNSSPQQPTKLANILIRRKILVIGQLPPPVHGSNVMAQRFMEALAENGFDARIVQKTFSQVLEEVGSVTLTKILRVPALCRNVISTIKEWQPELCVYFISVGLTSLLVDSVLIYILRYYKVPYLLYFHGQGYRKYNASRYLALRRVIRDTLSKAMGGLVLGERLKHDVSQHIPEEHLHILPNGIPDIHEVERIRYGKNGSVIKIMFLSNLIPSKGPMEFLRMAKEVLAVSRHQVHFTLTGIPSSNRYLKELNSFIFDHGLTGHVRITGPLYDQEKEALFRNSDIFVFPTRFKKETLGIVNLEAMQWGLPVISSPIGAIPEIIQDGINGYIVDPLNTSELTNRVMKLINNPGLRIRMGMAGRKLYEEKYSLTAYHRNVNRAMNLFLGVRKKY